MTPPLDALSGIRRRLILRLTLVGVLVSLLAGIAAWQIETARIDENLVGQASLEASHLSDQLRAAGPSASADDVLAQFIKSRVSSDRDFFVLVERYDPDKRSLGEASLADYSFVEKYFDRQGHPFPENGGVWFAKNLVRGRVYLQVVVSLTSPSGAPAGWFEGIYRLSPRTLKGVRYDTLRIVILAVMAVLLTASSLYPLMALLQGRIAATARGLMRANVDTMRVLGNAIAKRDSDTNAHNYRVAIYAVRTAEELKLDVSFIRRLIKGAFLHDVGKIGISDAILLKPGKLTTEEFAVMKTHVTHGLDIISGSQWLEEASEVVGGHHEKVDGSGYPAGLKGEEIPLSARIFAVADVFDALTSQRPYKKAFSIEEAIALLEQGRDRHFDGRILDAFLSVMPQVYGELSGHPDAVIEALAERGLRRYFDV